MSRREADSLESSSMCAVAWQRFGLFCLSLGTSRGSFLLGSASCQSRGVATAVCVALCSCNHTSAHGTHWMTNPLMVSVKTRDYAANCKLPPTEIPVSFRNYWGEGTSLFVCHWSRLLLSLSQIKNLQVLPLLSLGWLKDDLCGENMVNGKLNKNYLFIPKSASPVIGNVS